MMNELEVVIKGYPTFFSLFGGEVTKRSVLYIKSRVVDNFRLICMGLSQQWRQIFMQLDLDLAAKVAIYMCLLIKLTPTYSAFSAIFAPMPLSDRADWSERPVVWKSRKAMYQKSYWRAH